jgi:tetratricopeptide (TPR) repeat protein
MTWKTHGRGKGQPIQVTCSYCGAVYRIDRENIEDFLQSGCPKCGAPLTEESFTTSKPVLTRRCPFCGTENTLRASKCRKPSCGKPLPYLKDAEAIRFQNIRCENHPAKYAYVRCVSCGKYLCLKCQTTYKNSNYCADCLELKKAQEATRKRRVRFRITLLACFVVAAIPACLAFWLLVTIAERVDEGKFRAEKYDKAQIDLQAGRYEPALKSFVELDGYRDAETQAEIAKEKLVDSKVTAAEIAEEKGDFAKAAERYSKAAEYDPAFAGRYRETRVKAEVAVAVAELAAVAELSEGISIDDAVRGGESHVKLYDALAKTNDALTRLNRVNEFVPDNAELIALLATAEAERDRLMDTSEKVIKRRT